MYATGLTIQDRYPVIINTGSAYIKRKKQVRW